MRRRLLLVAFGLGLFGFGAVAGAAPAGADDCSSQVKSITDVLDTSVVQDCLRTGTVFGGVLGGITAVAGTLVAVSGLRRPDTDSSTQPCEGLKQWEAHLAALQAKKQELETQITEEFRSKAKVTQELAYTYRNLSDATFAVNRMYNLSVVAFAAGVGSAVTSVAGFLKAAGTLAFAAPAEAAAVAALKKEALMGAGTVVTGVMPPTKSFSLSDKGKRSYVDSIAAQVDSLKASYVATARQVNTDFENWGIQRQSELNAIVDEMKEAYEQASGFADRCPGAAPKPPVDFRTPRIRVPRVYEDFDHWLMSGAWSTAGHMVRGSLGGIWSGLTE